MSAAANAKRLPIPIIEAQPSEFIGSNHFASPGFCSRYWQFPLDLKSSEVIEIIALKDTFVLARVLHGLENASAFFLSTILLLLHTISHAIKAWTEKLALQTDTRSQLLDHLEEFFNISSKHSLRDISQRKIRAVHQIGQMVRTDHKQ